MIVVRRALRRTYSSRRSPSTLSPRIPPGTLLLSIASGRRGGRTIAIRQRMEKADNEDEWTEMHVQSIDYDLEIKEHVFTLSNLRNPRD